MRERWRAVFLATALILLGVFLILLRAWATAETHLPREQSAGGPIVDSPSPRHVRIFDLTHLPSEAQKPVALLLLLPIGILVTAFFRNLVGVQTFGTCLPGLLALSFTYADLRTGLIILAVLLLAVLAARPPLARLKLLMVPRLGLTLTLAVLCLTLAISAMNQFKVNLSAAGMLPALFIAAIIAERFLISMEDEGFRYALRILAGTVFVALLCLVIVKQEALSRSVFIYPEIHFGTAALLILIGRYSGYRLSELWRFRSFAKSDCAEAKK